MRERLLALIALVLAGVATTIATAHPARAECIEVTLEVHREGEPHWYPLGGPGYCVKDTPWNQGQDVTAFYEEDGELAPGVPTGFWLQVWTTAP